MEVGIAFMTRQQALLTLGLSMAARENDIRNAWRKKAKFFHPDSPYANTQAFLKSRQAFETLIPPTPQVYRIRARSRAV